MSRGKSFHYVSLAELARRRQRAVEAEAAARRAWDLAEAEAQGARERAEAQAREHAEAARRAREHQRLLALQAEATGLVGQLQALKTRAASRHVELPWQEIQQIPAAATSDQLEEIIPSLNQLLAQGLDRLETGIRRQAVEELAGHRMTQAESALIAAEQQMVADVVAAAQQAYEANWLHCAPEDIAELRDKRERIGDLKNLAAARAALHELEHLLTESISRHRARIAAIALRARLLRLIEDVSSTESEGLRKVIIDAPDIDLMRLEAVVESAVARESRERARVEVTAKLIRIVQQRKYTIGVPFNSMLGTSIEAIILASPDNPDYGVRLDISALDNHIDMTVVRRDDAPRGIDRQIQEQTCAVMQDAFQQLRNSGVEMDISISEPDGVASPEPGSHWPVTSATPGNDDVGREPIQNLRARQIKPNPS
jgi:hypothetical protein